jgi:septum site-determining protein MinC
MSEAVSFKGNKDGIVLLLDLSVEFESLCQMIVQKLWESRNSLGDHTSLIINSGAIALNDGQRLALKVLLQSLGHEVKYFLPEVPVEGTQKAAEQKISEPKVPDNKVYEPKVSAPKTIVPEVPAQTEAEVSSISELADIEHYLTKSALAVRKNIRSGQKISYDGTLIIFGDVNAGAELEAAGHILVLGALRGVAHAGCKGDKKAVIYANQLRSVQLRIADLIARAPDGENTKRNIPEIARIIDNYLVIEEV